MNLTTKLICGALVAALLPAFAGAQIVTDNFEVDSSADYTVVSLGDANDGTVEFAFDYVAAGIPLAPNSAAGDKGGLRFTANNALGADNVFTAFHNAALPANVVLTVDMYLGVTGFSGTTEYGHVGLGGDGATVNSIFSPVSGSGVFIAIDGDGDVTSDYRWSRPDPDPENTSGRDTVNGVEPDPSYLKGGSDNGFYVDLFPDGTPTPGSPGNLWTTLEMRNHPNGYTQISLDGTPIIFGPSIAGDTSGLPAGLASLGYGDVFTSVAQPTQAQFGIFDNLSIDYVPEPTSLLLAGIGALALVGARRRS